MPHLKHLIGTTAVLSVLASPAIAIDSAGEVQKNQDQSIQDENPAETRKSQSPAAEEK